MGYAPLIVYYLLYIRSFRKERIRKTIDFLGLQRLGPILGALVGLIPQCGFSILAAMLFVQNNITLGTLSVL